MLYFFYKIIIFIVNKKTVYEVLTVNSHNHIAHATFVFHNAMETLL